MVLSRLTSAETERLPGPGSASPLTPLALAAIVGIVADRFGSPFETRTWGFLALGASLIAGLFVRRCSVAFRAAAVVAVVALGAGWHRHCWSDLAPDDAARSVSEEPRPVWVQGVLVETLGVRPPSGPRDSGSTRAVLALTGASDGRRWAPASGRVLLSVAGERPDLEAGRGVEVAGNLAAVPGPLNPGEFDYRNHLRAEGVRLRLATHGPRGVWDDPARPDWPWTRRRGDVRRWSCERLVADLDPEVAPLAAALLLGRREGVDPDVNDAFARTGTTHLLAISGLHMQVLAGTIFLSLRWFGLGRRRSLAAVTAATIGYALLVGLMPSVVRSAAMTAAVCVARIVDRQCRPANLFALAALTTLALNPCDLFDVGGQLSFLAVGAIVWGVRPVEARLRFGWHALSFRRQGPGGALDVLERKFVTRWKKAARTGRGWLASGLVVSAVVWLSGLPLVALRFHLVSPISFLLNVPLIPFTSAALLAAGLALALSTIWGPLGAPAAWICALLLGGTERIVRWGVARPWGHAFVAGPSWAYVLIFYGLLGFAAVATVGRRPSRRWAWRGLGAWAALGIGLAWGPRPTAGLEAEVLAVGHGLAVVIRPGDGRTLLYDCGRLGDPGVGRRVIAPALWSKGISRIDEVILSHADSDHYNGLPDLLARFRVGVVRVPPGFAGSANPGAVRLLELVRRRAVPVRPIVAGDGWEGKLARLSVQHPGATWRPATSDNARSVVIDLEAWGRHALLTGDLEREGLRALVDDRPGRSFDAILAPHHGSRTANPGWLYDWADPALVVVSQRPPNPGNPDTLAALAERRVPLWRTWERGAVRLRWTRGGVLVRGFLDDDVGKGEETKKSGDGGKVMDDGVRQAAVTVIGFGLGLGLCLVLAVTEWGAWTMVLPGRRIGGRADDEGPGEPIEARAGDGVKLAGVWHPAAHSARTVLLLHGFAEPTSLRGRIESLNRHGWHVASLDSRGHGRSGGDRTSFGGREAGDLRAWIDALGDRLGTVAVWGRSMGSGIAVRAAAEDDRIAALVLESPYVDLKEAVAVVVRRHRIPCARLLAGLIARRAEALAGVSLTHPRPIDLAPRVAARTLIVHGSDDGLVAPADARRLAAAFPQTAEVVEVPGAGHANVIDVGGAEVLDRVAAFLESAAEGR